jgi:Na+/proline symporter
MGEMADTVTGGIVSYEAGVVLLAAMILFYETLGGMRAVAWTDAVQGVLMLVGLGSMLVWLLGAAGGLGAMTEAVVRVRPAAVVVPDARECANWASTIVLLGLASVVYPQAIQRVYAARDGRTLRRSFALMTFMPRVQGLGEIEADSVMPMLLEQWAALGPLATLAAVVVFMGALAAIMSTADSVLLSLGSIVSEDLLEGSERAEDATRAGKRAAAVVMAAMALLALVSRDVTLWGLIELKMELLIQCVPAFLLGLHWSGLRAGPTLVGALLGAGLATAASLLGLKRIEGVHIGVLTLGLNLAIAVLGSLGCAGSPKSPTPVVDPPAGSARRRIYSFARR